jgi:hypothetical protein
MDFWKEFYIKPEIRTAEVNETVSGIFSETDSLSAKIQRNRARMSGSVTSSGKLQVHYTVITDHLALKWLLGLKKPSSGRLCRWIMQLEHHDFVIEHRKDTHMEFPDILSKQVAELQLSNDKNSETDPWYTKLHEKINEIPDEYSAKLGDRNIKCQIVERIGSNTYRLKDVDKGKDLGVFRSKGFFS